VNPKRSDQLLMTLRAKSPLLKAAAVPPFQNQGHVDARMVKLGKKMPTANGAWSMAMRNPCNGGPERHWPIEQTTLSDLC
jgi:hypothetical protein